MSKQEREVIFAAIGKMEPKMQKVFALGLSVNLAAESVERSETEGASAAEQDAHETRSA